MDKTALPLYWHNMSVSITNKSTFIKENKTGPGQQQRKKQSHHCGNCAHAMTSSANLVQRFRYILAMLKKPPYKAHHTWAISTPLSRKQANCSARPVKVPLTLKVPARGHTANNLHYIGILDIWFYENHFDRLVQERRNSSALAMELRLSYTKPSI